MRLNVLIEGHLAGGVEVLSSRRASFGYSAAYLERAHRTPLSVRFPLRENPYDGPDVASWLWNLLPDDEEVLKRWCVRYGAPPDRPLELLGTVIGRECAGAVQFAPPEIAPELLSAAGGLQEITDDELWAGLRRLRGDWSFRFADAHGDAGRSLAGMQPRHRHVGRRTVGPVAPRPHRHAGGTDITAGGDGIRRRAGAGPGRGVRRGTAGGRQSCRQRPLRGGAEQAGPPWTRARPGPPRRALRDRRRQCPPRPGPPSRQGVTAAGPATHMVADIAPGPVEAISRRAPRVASGALGGAPRSSRRADRWARSTGRRAACPDPLRLRRLSQSSPPLEPRSPRGAPSRSAPS
ncbi:MAG: hypothetical protein F4236_00805 [Acidimicrobiia bacterium]|nr:hypothetical protein [Acidimicrobiia bacterium]MYE66764.1 hypothetical protein [Acidimicrobiia bacterium]